MLKYFPSYVAQANMESPDQKCSCASLVVGQTNGSGIVRVVRCYVVGCLAQARLNSDFQMAA